MTSSELENFPSKHLPYHFESLCVLAHYFQQPFFFFLKHYYLPAAGLLVTACKLLVVVCGIQFPDQGVQSLSHGITWEVPSNSFLGKVETPLYHCTPELRYDLLDSRFRKPQIWEQLNYNLNTIFHFQQAFLFFSLVYSNAFYLNPKFPRSQTRSKKRVTILFTKLYFPDSSSPLLFLKQEASCGFLWSLQMPKGWQKLPVSTRNTTGGLGLRSYPSVRCRSFCPLEPRPLEG